MADAPQISQGAVGACKTQLGVSTQVSNDVEAIRVRFNTAQSEYVQNIKAGMSEDEAFYRTPSMIPDSVADNAVDDKDRQTGVQNMIECVGARGGLNPQDRTTLKMMYREAVRESEFWTHPIRSSIQDFFGGGR